MPSRTRNSATTTATSSVCRLTSGSNLPKGQVRLGLDESKPREKTFAEELLKPFQKKKLDPELLQHFRDFTRELIVWGSPAVIEQYMQFREVVNESTKGRENPEN